MTSPTTGLPGAAPAAARAGAGRTAEPSGWYLAPALLFFVAFGIVPLVVAAVLALRGADWLDGRPFALSAIAQTLVMQVGQVAGYVRARHEIAPGSLDRGGDA